MSAFLVKLDENLAQPHVDFLNGKGYSAERVTDEGLSGADDAVVWQRAVAEGRFFLTLDLDFADACRFPPGTHPGILLLRLFRLLAIPGSSLPTLARLTSCGRFPESPCPQ